MDCYEKINISTNLNRVIVGNFEKKTPENRNKAALLNLLREIDNKYADYSINVAAETLKLSKCYFSRYFSEKTGVLFSTYLNYVRISKAIEIIKHDKTPALSALAQSCGFNNMRNFNRVFKNLTNTTPKKIQKNFILDYKKLLAEEWRDF